MADYVDSYLGPFDTLRGKLTWTKERKLEAPENIIRTLEAAKAVYYKFRAQHLRRIDLYARIEGLIAGNPPYDPTELKKHGLEHIANFNTLEARALWERGCLAYWNLLNEAETICKFVIEDPEPAAREAEDILSSEWDYVVRHWPAFETQMGTLSGQLLKFGISPVIWPDEQDWRWRIVELPKFFVSDQTQSDPEMMTAVAIETMFTAQYLFEVYEYCKDKKKDETPWNVEELANLLYSIANTHAKTSYEIIDFYDMQRRLQNGDIGYDVLFSDSIRIISLLYKEYDGAFSHYMFHRVYDHGNFLYFADRQYDSLEDFLQIFTASPGEYTIHSNRGLGHKIFAPCQANNQLICSLVDGSRWAATPLIRGLSVGSKDVEQIRFMPGVATNIGTAEFVQNNLGANIDQLVGTHKYITQLIQYNTANSGDDPGVPDRDTQGSISPTQAKMQSYREFGVLKENVQHFYTQFDRVILNMVVKMLRSKKGYPGYEYVSEWKERCIERGVPEDVFALSQITPWGMPRKLSVKATRVAGEGSTLARIMGLESLMPIAGDFGPREAKEYRRQWIGATMGKEQVTAFMQEADDADSSAGGASLAGVENAIMQSGQSPIFSPDNDQRAHFVTHMALGANIMQQGAQQQMSPIDADRVFTVLIPHIQQHFEAVSKSRFSQIFAREQKKNLDQLVKYATLNRKNAIAMKQAEMRKAQEEQQATQQAMTEEQRKNMQAMGDEKRKDFKIQSQVERAKEANATRAEVMREKVIRDAENTKLKVKLDHAAKTGKASASSEEPEVNPFQREQEIRGDIGAMQGATPSLNDFEQPATPYTKEVPFT